MKLVAGRNLVESDTIREYLVNEAFLRKMNIRDPQQVLGRRLQYYLSPVPLPIVGVVRDFHLQSLHEAIAPCLIASQADLYANVSILLAGNQEGSVRHLQQAFEKAYPNEVLEYAFLDEELARFYETEQMLLRLVNSFASIALLIGCLGLYGLVSYVVEQRTKEIGIRKVLGASVKNLVGLLSQDFLQLVLLANLIAWPLAGWILHHWLEDFAYRITLGWWLFAASGLSVLLIAGVTLSAQTIRAAKANPVKSLRSE
jgi:putative ABC transport system permease protein